MKKLSLLAVGLGLGLLSPSASGQIVLGSTNIADQVGQIILPDRIPLSNSPGSIVTIKPPRPERPDFLPEIRLRLLRFEKIREAYLARQEELLRKLRGATDSDRHKYRAQLQALRDEWLERARAFREEARERMKEMQPELSGRSKIWDEAIPKPSTGGRHHGTHD